MSMQNAPSAPQGRPMGEGDEMTGTENGAMAPQGQECFDPSTCCDEYERIMIEMMRAYLRPEQAPECLYERLRMTLDRCCCEDGAEGGVERTVIRHTVIRTGPDAR